MQNLGTIFAANDTTNKTAAQNTAVRAIWQKSTGQYLNWYRPDTLSFKGKRVKVR